MKGPVELSRLDRFYVYGVCIGGIVPVVIFWVADRAFALLPADLRLCYEVNMWLFAATVTACAVLPKIFPSVPRAWALRFCAITSLIYLNAFVFVTGGPLTSVFSYHYLYIPVVVGYSLGSRALRQAAMGCVGAYLIVLALAAWLYPLMNADYETELAAMSRQPSYIAVYLLAFLLQLLITYLMARSALPVDAEHDPAGEA